MKPCNVPLQVKQYVQEVSWLLKFQTDTDHGYAGLDGLHTSEYPIVRSGPLCSVSCASVLAFSGYRLFMRTST